MGAAHIALRTKDAEIVPATDRALTFSGRAAGTFGPGIETLSDPVDFPVPANGDIAVSLYFRGIPARRSRIIKPIPPGFPKRATKARRPRSPTLSPRARIYWLSGVEVLAPAKTALIVALGDSITESFRSTPDTNRGWPSVLSARLQADRATANFAVGNMGIGGNRLLHDGTGASALARLDRDVFSQPGVKWLILLEGINDIGRVGPEEVTAEDLIGADKQILERAHSVGIKVVGCTLPPFEGANYYRDSGEAVREALNNWIRTSGAFDAIADFEKATRDPADPKKLKAEYDPGDHLHLTDAGYKAMGDAVDLAIFKRK